MRVLVFGTFDLLHPGHLDFLKQASALGEELYVLGACDQAVDWAKGHKPEQDEKTRLAAISALNFATKAWVGEPVIMIEDYLRPIQEIQPDIIALGYDQAVQHESWLNQAVQKLPKIPQITRLKPYKPESYKTSLIKSKHP